jgi:hypothetical protein
MAACGKNDDAVLESGSYPKLCSSSSECKEKTGAFGECSCAVDGKKYCVPNPMNPDIIPEYFGICQNSQWSVDHNEHRKYQLRIHNDIGMLPCFDKLGDYKIYNMKFEDDDDFGYLVAIVGSLFGFF